MTDSLSVDAPEFVPGGVPSQTARGGTDDEEDVVATMPPAHQMLLRGGCLDPLSGVLIPYYVGRLKSYSSQKGFGFLSCAQSFKRFGRDVFIHKSLVDTPWQLGRPVEFLVSVNGLGQPQAQDVLWLPPLQFGSSAPMAARVPGGGYPAEAGSNAMSREQEARYLGTLKSYSATQGYGFVSCEQTWPKYRRDVYFDKSQTGGNWTWELGQILEFSVATNQKGQPVARGVNWDPVPKVVDGPGSEKRPPPNMLKSELQQLLRKIQSSEEIDGAVVRAIELSQDATTIRTGAPISEDFADYLSFVLDRLLSRREETTRAMKSFTKLLALLMLAKLVRLHRNAQRCRKTLDWVHILVLTIDVSVPDVMKQQSPSTIKHAIKQVINTLLVASQENPTILDNVECAAKLSATARVLEDKLRSSGP